MIMHLLRDEDRNPKCDPKKIPRSALKQPEAGGKGWEEQLINALLTNKDKNRHRGAA